MSSSPVRLYTLQAPIYDASRWPVLFGRRRLVELLELRPGQRVLEIGCGTGVNLARAARTVGESGRVVGVDVTPAMLRRAARRVARCGAGCASVELIEGSFDAHGLGNAKFDAVVFSYSLSLIGDWRDALAHARRRLEPGGRLGVVDFLTAPPTPARWLIRFHGVELGAERRACLRADAGIDVTRDEEHRAYGGLWGWFLTVGVRRS